VALKIDYWNAVDAGDDARAQRLSTQARRLADDLKNVGRQEPSKKTAYRSEA
jgi:hypothetical protein